MKTKSGLWIVLGLALMTGFTLWACAGGDDDDSAGGGTDDDTNGDDADDTGDADCPSVLTQVQGLLDASDLPFEILAEGDCAEVTEDDLSDRAAEVVEEMVFLDESGSPTKVADSDVPQEDRDAFASNLIDEGLIAAGNYVLELDWETDDGTPFTTLAVVAGDDDLLFDSMVFFSTVSEIPGEDPGDDKGWNVTHSGGWENVFGGTITWDLAIGVQTDGCLIVDPAPHATVSPLSSIFGCEVKATVKETPYCSPNQECQHCTAGTPKTEDAIKVEVNIAFACGFTSIKIGADGFTLEVEGNLGTNGSESHTYNVGAASGLISYQ